MGEADQKVMFDKQEAGAATSTAATTITPTLPRATASAGPKPNRSQIVEEIGRIKQRLTLPIYEPKREDQVFHNVTSSNPGPLSGEAVKRVFERIIDEMRTVQRDKMR